MFLEAQMTLVIGFDDNGRDHDNMLLRVLLICKELNLKLNKDKVMSDVHQSLFW